MNIYITLNMCEQSRAENIALNKILEKNKYFIKYFLNAHIQTYRHTYIQRKIDETIESNMIYIHTYEYKQNFAAELVIVVNTR